MKSGSGGFTAPCFKIRFGFVQEQAVNNDLGSNIYAVLCSGKGYGEVDDTVRMTISTESKKIQAPDGNRFVEIFSRENKVCIINELPVNKGYPQSSIFSTPNVHINFGV